jgi:hypothetical protein
MSTGGVTAAASRFKGTEELEEALRRRITKGG